MTFRVAAALAEIEPGTSLAVDLGAATQTAIVRTFEGEVYAIADVCSHAEVPLSTGEVEGLTIECYMHGSCFDLRTGRPLQPPAIAAVPIYPVKLDGESILVDIDNPIQIQEN